MKRISKHAPTHAAILVCSVLFWYLIYRLITEVIKCLWKSNKIKRNRLKSLAFLTRNV